jgi:NAD(P)-dependent dehydrogenase (short-subunit alcohol dehydrogenase family)
VTHVLKLFDLTGQTAVVTGAGSGLGKQMAHALAEAGANVAIASRRLELCQSAIDEICRPGQRGLALQMDVTKPEQVQAMAEAVTSEFGSIDILVNNAAMLHIDEAEHHRLEDWQRVMAVNVTGVFTVCQAVGAVMIRQEKGKIINIASVYGQVGIDSSLYVTGDNSRVDMPAYGASKGAIIALTRNLAAGWARFHINVNAITPGMCMTELTRDFLPRESIENLERRTPLGRFGGEEDLKGAVVYLASAASDFVTGHNLVVDGGWLSW